MKIFTTAIVLTAFVAPLAAQWAQYRTPGMPRTADGNRTSLPRRRAPPMASPNSRVCGK